MHKIMSTRASYTQDTNPNLNPNPNPILDLNLTLAQTLTRVYFLYFYQRINKFRLFIMLMDVVVSTRVAHKIHLPEWLLFKSTLNTDVNNARDMLFANNLTFVISFTGMIYTQSVQSNLTFPGLNLATSDIQKYIT